MKNLEKLFLFIVICIFSLNSAAWNKVGHQVVAQIAYANLTPESKNAVNQLVDIFAKEYPQHKTFVSLADWPDEIRGQHIETFTRWHYIDLAFSTDGSPLKKIYATDNALWAIPNCITIVKNKKANNFERARFLAFLIHITGDLHQPLHGVSRISKDYLDGDEGGNLFPVKFLHKKSNLHHAWDDGLGYLNPEQDPKQLAEMIMENYPQDYFINKINLPPSDWAIEDSELAKNFVYNTQPHAEFTVDYIDQAQKYTQQRLALAGYRLAAIINSIFRE